MHQHVRVVLSIPAHRLLHYYHGEVDVVVATAVDGRIIRFPANILRSVVQNQGVYGTFELVFDENHKFVSIKRVVDS